MKKKTFNNITKALKQALCHTQWQKVEDKMGKYNIFEDENFKKENNMKLTKSQKVFYTVIFVVVFLFLCSMALVEFLR